MAYYHLSDVSETANEFKEANRNLTDFEALQLALQYHGNEIEAEKMKDIQRIFGVEDPSDTSPLLSLFDMMQAKIFKINQGENKL